MIKNREFKLKVIAAIVLLTAANVAIAEDYQLPAAINKPMAMPVGADEFQNVTGNAISQVTADTNKPSTDLPTLKLSDASRSSPAVASITDSLNKNPSLVGLQAQEKSGQYDTYGRAQAGNAPQKAQSTGASSKTDELYAEAKNRYKDVQRVTLPPGGNMVLPISRGLQNRISTTFKNASVSTSTLAEEASIFVNGGDVFISTNTDKPIGIMISEDSVPESTFNLTLMPLDVPGAMISVNTALSPKMEAKREKTLDEQNYQQMLERSQQEDMQPSDPRQDDHKQRVINLLTPVALGEVPSGFSLQEDRLSRIPASEQSPCHFNMYAKMGQRLVGARELIDVVLVKNDKPYGQVVADQQCLADGVIATALFDKAYLQPGEETELYIIRDKLFQERQTRVTTRPSLIKR
ncbi:TrhK [Buttiauxella gaviniae]|uniref:TrhK n=1 Tax=Buttiauxella gaviniae TaxID=82990 RepID=UPI003C7347C5